MPHLSAPSRIVTDGRTEPIRPVPPIGPATVFAQTRKGRHCRMTPYAHAAFLVLEAGWSQVEAAEETGLHVQSVRDAVDRSLARLYPVLRDAEATGERPAPDPAGHVAFVLGALSREAWTWAYQIRSNGKSRTTTRTALRRLRQKGLVEGRPPAGGQITRGSALLYRLTDAGEAALRRTHALRAAA